jgi:endonuclease/exonuclease/phosphatase family metal-dependent hydrolase
MENLFDRAKGLNLKSWSEGKPVLDAFARLNALLEQDTYSDVDKQKIVDGLTALGLNKRDDGGEYVILRQNRGHLLKRPRSGPPDVVADGRADWIGWIELKTEAVNEVATRNTARVVADVGADVLAVVEAEDRTALRRFNENLLSAQEDAHYDHIMLIDGNDERGIDVGVLTRADHAIVGMRSHVDDTDDSGEIFSRDCAEYDIETASGARVLLLVNHLKSKGFGSQASSNDKRRRQAERIRQIYDERRADGVDSIAILGDFNDTPDSDPLAPLLGSGSDLQDVSAHSAFEDDGRPGTFGNGTKSAKFDYILMSPALFGKVTKAGVFRKGVWGGKNGTLFEHYDTITKAEEAASDHAAIWADVDL